VGLGCNAEGEFEVQHDKDIVAKSGRRNVKSAKRDCPAPLCWMEMEAKGKSTTCNYEL